MKMREINKVVDVISRNLNIPECDIVIEPIEDILVFVVPNKYINYRDICYSVSKRVIDVNIYEKIMKEVDHRALFISHSAVDNVGLQLEPLYDNNDIVKIAGEILLNTSVIEYGLSNMKDILESVNDLIKLLDKDPSFKYKYSLKTLKDLRLLAQNKLINNPDILCDFNFESGEDISDKDRAAVKQYKLENMICALLKKTIYRIITDDLDKDFIIVI